MYPHMRDFHAFFCENLPDGSDLPGPRQTASQDYGEEEDKCEAFLSMSSDDMAGGAKRCMPLHII